MSLQAKELMVGDWIQFTDGNKKCTVVGVKCDARYLEEEAIITVMDDSGHWFDKELECLQPIPLTPEILEKNGFIKDADKDDKLTDVYHLLVPTGFERNSFTIQVSLYREPISGVSTLIKCWGWLPPHNGGMNDIHLCSANYVHELQHALKLCGIEKTIEA